MLWIRRAHAAGWSTVVLCATAGLAVAALLALTPWRVPDLSGARDRVGSVRENQTVEHSDDARSSFIAVNRGVLIVRWLGPR
jgi:hypothetical protein